jgi:hypothetical protein
MISDTDDAFSRFRVVLICLSSNNGLHGASLIIVAIFSFFVALVVWFTVKMRRAFCARKLEKMGPIDYR